MRAYLATVYRVALTFISRTRQQRGAAKAARSSHNVWIYSNYKGVRISATGRKFLIENAAVWNIVDDLGRYHGQAAVFDKWSYLEI